MKDNISYKQKNIFTDYFLLDKNVKIKLMNKLNPLAYLRGVLVELDLVKWPNHQETLRLTAIVVAGSVLVGAYIGGLDLLFINLLTKVIGG